MGKLWWGSVFTCKSRSTKNPGTTQHKLNWNVCTCVTAERTLHIICTAPIRSPCKISWLERFLTQLDSRKSHARKDALAGLRTWNLRRDDESDPGGRLYWDAIKGNIFQCDQNSEGKPHHQSTKASTGTLAGTPWIGTGPRSMAAKRGPLAHTPRILLLKPLLAWHATQQTGETGTAERKRWAGTLSYSHHKMGSPQGCGKRAFSVSWSSSGYARGLRGWTTWNAQR